MKMFLIFIFITLFASCEESFHVDEDDSVVSGTVTTIWSNLGLSSAHAQTAQETHDFYSGEYLQRDLFTSISGSDYSTLVSDSLTSLNSFLSLVGPLVHSNASKYSDADFVNGMGISLGFDSSKKIVSILLSPVKFNGTYYFKDSKSKLVSFYKMSFILKTGSEYKYRQSFVFKQGKAVKENINYSTSAASIKISEELATDPTLGVPSLKSKLAVFKNEVTSTIYKSDEEDAVSLFLAHAYPDFYSILDPIQKTVLESTVLHAMRQNAALKSYMLNLRDDFRDFLAVARPARLYDFALAYEDQGAYVVYEKMLEIKNKLMDNGNIPNDRIR
jgi:hypothetical protein